MTAARGSTVLTRTPVAASSSASPLRQAVQRRLRRAVHAHRRVRASGRAVADDTLTIQPSLALDHRRQHGLREVERRVHVDLER